MKRLLSYLVLPSPITEFEARYLARTNRIALWLFVAHVPLLVAVAALNRTNPLLALVLSSLALAGPLVSRVAFENPRVTSVMYGFTASSMGGLLVHFGQGPVQIEMHFYFFVLIALLAIFGNPLVILAATITVAAHHALLWLWLPSSVFNYAAPLWVVAVHSLFVVIEAAASCFLARSFFDNVIGLERIVEQRTHELDLNNRALRLVLDNTEQVLTTLDASGAVGKVSSAMAQRWLGEHTEGEPFARLLRRRNAAVANMFEVAWEQTRDGFFPRELALAQLPSRMVDKDQTLRIEYKSVAEDTDTLLVIGTDISAEVWRDRLEIEKRESVALFQRIASDRRGVLAFCQEADALVAALDEGGPALARRRVHTLKGIASVFGLRSLAEPCHVLETEMGEGVHLADSPTFQAVRQRWAQLKADLDTYLGSRDVLEIQPQQLALLHDAINRQRPYAELQRILRCFRLEPVRTPLERARDQALDLAERLGKTLRVELRAESIYLDPAIWAPLWSSFGHAIRNAIDHGVEPEDERRARGKDPCGRLLLEAFVTKRRATGAPQELVIAVTDDGRGLDWERVRQKTAARQLPSSSHADLVTALFTDHISTKDQVTDVSGRGIGLGALRDACEALGGRVRIAEDVCVGTRIELRFALPLASIEHEPSQLHAA